MRESSDEKPPHAWVALPNPLRERPLEEALAPAVWMGPNFLQASLE